MEQPRSQGLSSSRPSEKMRDPGNEVVRGVSNVNFFEFRFWLLTFLNVCFKLTLVRRRIQNFTITDYKREKVYLTRTNLHLPCIWNPVIARLINPMITRLRACLHGGGGPQVGEVTCGGSPHLSCKRDQIKMRDYYGQSGYPTNLGSPSSI